MGSGRNTHRYTADLHVYAFIEALRRIGYNVSEEHAKAFRQRLGKRFMDIVKEIFPNMPEDEIERLKNIRRGDRPLTS